MHEPMSKNNSNEHPTNQNSTILLFKQQAMVERMRKTKVRKFHYSYQNTIILLLVAKNQHQLNSVIKSHFRTVGKTSLKSFIDCVILIGTKLIGVYPTHLNLDTQSEQHNFDH